MRPVRALCSAVASLTMSLAAGAQPCEPGWLEGFPMSDLNGIVRCMTEFDDGSGPAMYVAASYLTSAGGVPVMGIARWDGSAWNSPGSGLMMDSGYAARIDALVACDTGGRSLLYAGGGGFLFRGFTWSQTLAAWDGGSWSPVPGGPARGVSALCSHRLDGKTMLSVAGDFGAYPDHDYRIKCFDGVAWTTLGEAFVGLPSALTSFDDGSGPVLYGAGAPGGFSAKGTVLRWTGAAWEAVPDGQPDGAVLVMRPLDVGDGRALYVGGAFGAIQRPSGDLEAAGIVRFSGAGWSAVGGPGDLVGSGGKPIVSSIARWSPGGVVGLVLGGDVALATDPTARGVVARVNGTWVTPGGGFVGPVNSVEEFGGRLYAGGEVIRAGGSRVNHIARFDGASWSSLDGGPTNTPSRLSTGWINSVVRFDGPGGPLTYASGRFWGFDDFVEHGIAVWDGKSWAIGDDGGSTTCNGLLVHDDGSGPAMYGVGAFQLRPGVTSPVARWDGSSWSEVGHFDLVLQPPPADFLLYLLAEHDDGTGKKLYVAGIAGSPYYWLFVANWDGEYWREFSTQLPYITLAQPDPWSLTSAPGMLYLTGSFNLPFSNCSPVVTTWDGSSWSYAPGWFGDGPERATAAAVREGTLYVAGRGWFSGGSGGMFGAARLTAGGFEQLGPPLGPHMTTPRSMGWFNDGIVERMYIGGSSCCVGLLDDPQSLVTYDGTSWRPFAGGVVGQVVDVSVLDDGTGQVLWVSGNLVQAGGKPTHMIGRYRGCAGGCAADYNGDGFADGIDYDTFNNDFESPDPAQRMHADFNHDGVVDGLDYDGFMSAFNAGC